MSLIGTIALAMTANADGFNSGVASAGASLNKFHGNAEKGSTSAGGSMLGFAGKALAALGVFKAAEGLGSFFTDGVMRASDLNETLSKTKAIFGDASGVITSAGDEMAKAFGTDRTEFLTSAGNFGAVFKGVGQSQADAAKLGVSLSKLGMDMASFDNTSNAEAFTAISAALRGEFDPIEKFRVFLTADAVAAEAMALGLAKSKKEITESAKKQATYSLIMKQTADAQGDLERTAGGAANQFRKAGGGLANFATEIGSLLLPAVQSGVSVFNEFLASVLEVFEGLKPTITEWVGYVTAGVETVGVVVRNFGLVWGIVKLKAQEMFTNLGVGFMALPEVIGTVAEYVANNWYQLITDALNATATAFTNFGSNLGRLGFAVVEFLKNPGGGFNFEWTPLLQGFKATADKFPELARPAWVSMQDEIDKLGAEMADNEGKRAAIASGPAAKAKTDEAKKAAEKELVPKLAGAAEVGSKEAYETLARFQAQGLGGSSGDSLRDVAKNSQTQVAEQRRTNALLAKVADKGGTGGAEVFAF